MTDTIKKPYCICHYLTHDLLQNLTPCACRLPDNLLPPGGVVIADLDSTAGAVKPEDSLVHRVQGEAAGDAELGPRQFLGIS